MLARILCIPDLHKRYIDSANIKGQVMAIKHVQQDLINLNTSYEFTHNILLGDWYHKGYHSVGHAWSDIQDDRKLSESVNGNVYLTIGNHAYLERDNNPEMYVIQPNDLIHPSFDIATPDKPIFNVVPQLQIGNVQIDFFHFSKINKDYIAPRNPGVTYRIGIYHDDCVVPGWVREKEGYLSGSVSQVYLNKIYEDIDLAIIGHIHTEIGVVKVELNNGRTVPLIIPGSLGITSSAENQRHAYVKLPVLEIEDDSTVSFKQIKQSTHLECMTFIVKQKPIVSQSTDDIKDTEVFTQKNLLNVSEFMRSKGYDETSLKLVHMVSNTAVSLNDLIEFIQKEQQNGLASSI